MTDCDVDDDGHGVAADRETLAAVRGTSAESGFVETGHNLINDDV